MLSPMTNEGTILAMMPIPTPWPHHAQESLLHHGVEGNLAFVTLRWTADRANLRVNGLELPPADAASPPACMKLGTPPPARDRTPKNVTTCGSCCAKTEPKVVAMATSSRRVPNTSKW